MAVITKSSVKSYFETGDKPTRAQFVDLIDSYQDYSSALTGLVAQVVTAANNKVVAADGLGGFKFQNAGAGTLIGPSITTQYGLVTYADTSGLRTDNNNVTLSSAGDMSGLNVVSASAIYANVGVFDNLQFQRVNASAGNFGTVTVSGDVTVSGQGSFRDITSTGRITASAAKFTGLVSAENGIQVSGNSTFKSIVSAENGLFVSGNATFKSLVSAENGLTVSGAGTFKNDITVSGDGSFRNITSTGNITGSAAAFSGLLAANNGLTVSGAAVFKQSVTVSGDLSVSGDGTFRNLTTIGTITASAANFSGPVGANNGLNVSGNAAFKQSVTVSGDVGVSGRVTTKDLTVTGNITGSAAAFSGPVSANNGMGVSGALTVNGKVTTSGLNSTAIVSAENGIFVSGGATFKSLVSAENGLFVSGAGTFKNDITVSGDGSFRNITSTGNITASAAAFSGLVNANNGLTVSGPGVFKQSVTVSGDLGVSGNANLRNANLTGNLLVSGNAYVSGTFTGGGVGYRVFTAVTTCSIGDFGKVLVCQASTTVTVALRDGSEALPQGYNVRVRMRRSGMVQVIIPANDKIVGGVAYQITAQNKEALFEVESVSASEHVWWSAGTN